MGYDYPARQGGIAGNPCVGIWDELTAVCEGLYCGAPPKAAFDLPDTLTEAEFCPLSGGRPNPWCAEALGDRSVVKGWFVMGTEPSTTCPLHEEPSITIPPSDPNDPDRIPLLPEDLIPDPPPHENPPSHAPKNRGDGSPLPWISRWFKRFAGKGS
jgi:hypothetical protein